MISFTTNGSWKKTTVFLEAIHEGHIYKILNRFGEQGRAALEAATPSATGLAAHSWSYKVTQSAHGAEIVWTNSDIENGFPVAIMIQYGHSTGTGGWVQGRDYINPTMRPIFDQIADAVWKEVTSL